MVGCSATGTYRFKTGFYGLTDMPADFPKAIDCTLTGHKNIFCFLDDILIASRGTKEEHLKLVEACLDKLENENLAISLRKCKIVVQNIEWLGYKIDGEGVIPLVSKIESVKAIERPTTHTKLRSFMGAVHHFTKHINNLAAICAPFRDILKKENKYIWTDSHQLAFDNIKQKLCDITLNNHFDKSLPLRIRCDASHAGLGCCLEQYKEYEWQPIAFASRFLNSCVQKYSTNELELLGVVWSCEHFRHYLFGSSFTVQTDHRALLSVLKENRANKTCQSRLTRWLDRLLPFEFIIEHIPGSKMGLVDLMSRSPLLQAPKESSYDRNFIVATITSLHNTIVNQLNKNENICPRLIQRQNATIRDKRSMNYSHAEHHIGSVARSKEHSHRSNKRINHHYSGNLRGKSKECSIKSPNMEQRQHSMHN